MKVSPFLFLLMILISTIPSDRQATCEMFHNEWTQKYVVKDNQITEMTEYNIQVERKPDEQIAGDVKSPIEEY